MARSDMPKTSRTRSMMVAVVVGATLTAIQPSARASQAENPAVVNDIARYCLACWRNARLPADTWQDCTQEVFTRLLERIQQDRWPLMLQGEGDDRREFIRAIDTVKKRVQRTRKYNGLLDEIPETRSSADPARNEIVEELKHAAGQILTTRQQRIIELSAAGSSVQEIADTLQLPTDRVSDEKYKAIQKLRKHFAASGTTMA